MDEAAYARHIRYMSSLAGIAGTRSKRRDAEMVYFTYHKKRGVRLRGKYRP